MMTKIEYIKKHGLFENFRWNNDIKEFSNFNRVYGWNYSGKNTLSRIFRCIELEQMHHDFSDGLKGEFKDNALKLWGIKKELPKKDGVGGNLKYYKTDFVPAKATDISKEKRTLQSSEMLCLRENTFEPVPEDGAIKIFRNKEKHTAILFDRLAIPKLKEIIKEYDKPVQVYIFSSGGDSFAEEFSAMKKDKVTVKSIPGAILSVYRRIFN